MATKNGKNSKADVTEPPLGGGEPQPPLENLPDNTLPDKDKADAEKAAIKDAVIDSTTCRRAALGY